MMTRQVLLRCAMLAGLGVLGPSRAPSQEIPAGLADRMDGLLRAELSQHWYPAAVDRERGGFHQNFDRNWNPLPDTNVFVVYQARMVWTAAAFAAYAPEHRQEYLAYARHGLRFLDTVLRDREGGGFHWMLGPDGQVDPAIGTEKHLYGTSFVIYAASTLRAVGGDDDALRVARDAFDWLDTHGHDAAHGGYLEAYARDGTPITTWDPQAPVTRRLDRMSQYYGFKSMNAHIHMLEAVTALARVDDRPVVRERLAELLAIVRDRIAVDPGALNLYLTADWRAIPGHDSFGHDVETAYLLVEAAEVLGLHDDEATWRRARQLVDHALDHGWDATHGGFYDKGESFGQAYGTDKIWWTQAEGLNALLVMHDRFGKETDRYRQAFQAQWAFIETKQLDPSAGGWFGETSAEGRVLGTGAKATPWKANYHTSRALMHVVKRLRQRAAAAGPG